MKTPSRAAIITLVGLIMPSGCSPRPDYHPESGAIADPDGDLLVINARIWTADELQKSATAMLVREGVFIHVGDESSARSKTRQGARIIDAGGRIVIPGLIDSHLHLIDGGLQLSRLNLRDVPDRPAFIEAVRRRATETPPGRWIQGGRWSTESWPDPTQPNKEWIDAVTPDNPALLSRMDGHAALANRIALDKAGIDLHGPEDPPGGQIERDPATGEPTGILKDTAIELVRRQIPELTDTELDAGLVAAMKHANEHGITCVHTMSGFSHLAVFDRARERGALTLRIRQYISEDQWQDFIGRAKAHRNDDWVRVAGFKAYADGSLGSRTAFMKSPYADNSAERPDWRGLVIALGDSAALTSACVEIMRHSFAPAIHAIGDEANAAILRTYSTALRQVRDTGSVGGPPPMPRIEHAQHLLPESIPEFAAYGVVASMQPLHKADDARYAEKAIGVDRCKTSYAFRSLIDAGAVVAFGSDWPVVSLDPFSGVRAAVTGLSLDRRLFVPEQNITVDEALICYTRNAACAAGDVATLGMIREGLLADFLILDFDPFTIDPAKINRFRGETFVAGRRVAQTSNTTEPTRVISWNGDKSPQNGR
ncbi:MAG: amidohydrolase [Phycisphaerae bacterium]|nr:amidohydrolase [Phycisphaerae bacterium]